MTKPQTKTRRQKNDDDRLAALATLDLEALATAAAELNDDQNTDEPVIHGLPASAFYRLGPRTMTAAEMMAEEKGFRWADHARDRNTDEPYPLQSEKIAAIRESYRVNGIRPFIVTARVNNKAKTIDGLECRHRVACLPPETVVSLNVIECDEIAALRHASYSNAEGLGFTLMAALEQIQALVLKVCDVLARPDGREKLADLPLPADTAKSAYTADAKRNPFTSRGKSEAWTALDFTGEGLARYAAMSPASVNRCLRILSGLWIADLPPNVLAGASTGTALEIADMLASLQHKKGTDVLDLVQKGARDAAIAAMIAGNQVKSAGDLASTPAEIATAVYLAAKKPVTTNEPPPPPAKAPRGEQRDVPTRVHDELVKLAALIKKENAEPDSMVPNDATAKAANAALRVIVAYFKTSARTQPTKVETAHDVKMPAILDNDAAEELTDEQRADAAAIAAELAEQHRELVSRRNV